MEESRDTNAASAILITFVVLLTCKFAQAVVEPVAFAVFIIAIAWPIQKALQRRMPKAAALLLTIGATAAIVLALFSLIAWGAHQIADWIRQNLNQIQVTLVSSTAWLEEHDIFVLAMITEHFNATALISLLHAVVVRANTVLAFSVIVLIYVIMGLGETEVFQRKIAALKNEDRTRRLLTAARTISEKYRTYIVVRTVASIATGLAVWAFTRYMGLELAPAWGVLAFALNYLPYIGPLVATALPALFAFVQFEGPQAALLVLLGLTVLQSVIGSYLEPLLSGTTLCISPPVVVFTIILWTFLWGALGAFLGVPIAIATLTICEQFPSTRWISEILSGEASGRTPKPQ